MPTLFSAPRLRPVVLCFAALALWGCNVSSSDSLSPVHDAVLTGIVHGGQQPVSGAKIQLYVVGATGIGSASTALGSSTTTAADGSFSLTGKYSCPAEYSPVYLLATGGNPGVGAANPNLAMISVLGQCVSLGASTFIWINENTTAAAVSQLAAFMTGPTAIGGAQTDQPTLQVDFALVPKFVSLATGNGPGTALISGGTASTSLLYTIGDLLSPCINSLGGTSGDGSACGKLFALTTANGVTPTETVTAALQIARNPTTNTTGLFALVPASPPFQPAVTTAPSTFALTYTQPGTTYTGTANNGSVNYGGSGGYCSYTASFQNIELSLTVNSSNVVTDSYAALYGNEQLAASCSLSPYGPFSETFHIVSSTVTSTSLVASFASNDGANTFTLNGTISGGVVSGTMQLNRGDEVGTPIAWSVNLPFSLATH